jgi:hypothetical protein
MVQPFKRADLPSPPAQRRASDPVDLPPISIVVSKASQTAIAAIEAAGGKIECRYHNTLGLRAVLSPHLLCVLAKLSYKRTWLMMTDHPLLPVQCPERASAAAASVSWSFSPDDMTVSRLTSRTSFPF